ncbi:CehA/McbA family metallohydrolase [Halomarina oriensis]|uniref:Phosphoesterase n=1 Tax=Halomarina oriensis TaxID=671145 RepID=A0A6B0GSZ7_9EURY|nr:PHP domain-containing protein [Halomarina oriensis]MWG35803.1 phosphoesterase [Halomarina oriensis]
MSDGVTVTVDPHVHSAASYDGHDPVDLLLEQAAAVGLDGIVVTDHDTIEASLRAADLAPEYGLVGIPGVEVSTAQGHLLAIGVEERPPPRRSLDETVDVVREMGGVAVVPHPFQRTRHGVRRRFIEDCDAVEVYNAWVFTGYRNRRARRFAARHDFTPVAASDAHRAPFIGRAYTEVTVEDADSTAAVDESDVLDALDDGATATRGRRQPLHRSAAHYLTGAARKANHVARRRLPGVGAVPSPTDSA